MELLHYTATHVPDSSEYIGNGVGRNGATTRLLQPNGTGNGTSYQLTPLAVSSRQSVNGLENSGFGTSDDHSGFHANGLTNGLTITNGAINGNRADHYARDNYMNNFNQNAVDTKLDNNGAETPTPLSSSKPLILEKNSADQYPFGCSGRRRRPIGEKCFALLLVFIIFGMTAVAFGATCMFPVNNEAKILEHCRQIGGFATGLIFICGGASLLLLSIVSCVLINECSGRELHGGKCHINCHIFEDLVE